ncbi:MAG: type IX secretion system sortase PorU [Candidatus Kryptoniota bacterium]
MGIFSSALPQSKTPNAGQEISILSQGANSTTIQVIPDSLGADTMKIGQASHLNLLFKDAFTENTGNGSFVRQFIPVMVGVFSKQIQVHVVQADYETISMLPPVRGQRTFAAPKPQAISQFVSYNTPFEQRKHIVVRIRIYPFSYDSLSGKYQMLKKIIIQVASAGGGVSTQNMTIDKLLSQSLVNYSQVQNAVTVPPSHLRKTLASSLLASGTWYKLSISHSGIYKLTYQALKNDNVPVDNIQLSTIRIFNNGGRELPEDPNASRPSDLTENAIYVYNGNTDGTDKFESGDYILFYGKSPREWSYNPSSKTYSHYLNHYTESNFYFMTYGGQTGKRMQSVPSYHASSYYVPQNFTSGIAEDDETHNLIGSGKDWYGTQLTPPSPSGDYSTVLYSNKLNGLDPTQEIRYNVSLIARSTATNFYTIYENATGTELGYVKAPIISSGDYTDIEYDYADPLPVLTFFGTGNLQGDISILKIAYSSASSSAQGYVYWYEILYKRKFQASGDTLNFYAPDTNAAVYYSIQGFSSDNVKVFDVSDTLNVNMVQPDSINNNTASFGIQTFAGSSKQFYAVGENGYRSIDSISAVQNSDIHGQTAGANLIIITPPDFISQTDSLAAFKQSFDGLTTMVVPTTAMYNEFGCGIPDPTAIRDFLKYAYTNYQITPSYVILFGAGTYDYKNKLGSIPEYVPPYESDESLDQIDSYTTDDYFVELDATITSLASPISMSIGRLPVRNTGDATAVVSKIMQYESKPDYGNWRNIGTFVADGYDGSGNPDPEFEGDVEPLAKNYVPQEFDERKIYLGLYPTVVSTEGIRKPEAAADMVNQINDGTLVVNFVGHGAPDVWSFTHVFENDVTVPELINFTKLSLFIGATCDFGRDDNPQEQSGAELLTLSPQGGAIGIVSSARVVYNTNNLDLNQYFLQQLFVRDEQRNPTRVGDAFFRTKQVYYGGSDYNDLKYQYIGDPTVRFGMPKYLASLDSLNGNSLAQTQPDSIRALSKLDIKGTIYQPDANGNEVPWGGLSSTALLTIYDSQKQVPDPNYPGTSYTFEGSQLFSGQVSINNGKFEATAVMPTDISYSNSNGKIELYFQGNGADGSGYTTNVIVGGTDTTAVNNHVGPLITIYFDSTNYKTGDVVSQNPTLFVNLHSINGINLSDAAVGHTLQATFDGQQSVNLAPFYAGNVDSYQDGTIKYPVTLSLAPGEHSVTVSAFDVFNNEGDTSATFDIESSAQLSITNVYNYPDPFSGSTAFTFQRNGGVGEPINVKIKIFTLSGRLIKTIEYPGMITGNDTFVKIPWDGLDNDGNRLANGVYLYKVVASTVDGSQTSEALGKMAVLR